MMAFAVGTYLMFHLANDNVAFSEEVGLYSEGKEPDRKIYSQASENEPGWDIGGRRKY